MKCENCNIEHDGEYGSGRFCSCRCARSFSSKEKREERNKKISISLQKPEKQKFCKKCEKRLSHTNKSGFCRTCKPPAKSRSECISDYRRKRKQELVEYKGGKCEICGYDKSFWALHFHHKNPLEKDFQISNGNPRSIVFDKKEVEKCILVCSNCHAEIHEILYKEKNSI